METLGISCVLICVQDYLLVSVLMVMICDGWLAPRLAPKLVKSVSLFKKAQEQLLVSKPVKASPPIFAVFAGPHAACGPSKLRAVAEPNNAQRKQVRRNC